METHKNEPPIAEIPQQIFLPEYQPFQLDNGITGYYLEDPALQLFRLRLVSRTGADREAIPGLARLTMSVLTKGTSSRSAQQIAEELEYMGAAISSSADWDACAVSLAVLPEFGSAALSIFADIIQNPTFPEFEVERLRKQHIAGLLQSKFDPSYQASFALNQVLFAHHPYQHSLDGTVTDLTQITRKDCEQFYRETFVPQNVFIVAAGSYPLSVLKTMLNAELGAWQRTAENVKAETLRAVEFPATPTLGVVDNPEAVQAEMALSIPAPSYTDSLYPAFLLANTVLSGSFLSRLNRVLREEKGYTYGIFGSVRHRRYAHFLVIRTSIGNEVLDSAVATLQQELVRFGAAPVDTEEVRLARRYLLGQMAIRLESVGTILGMLVTQELYHLPPNFYQQLYHQLQAVSMEQLQQVQQRYFHHPSLAIGVSGQFPIVQRAFARIPNLQIRKFSIDAVVEHLSEEE